ncbi:MAG: ECF transporter S component [Clostridiaceae bacterium]|jgi:uncharacterized membrane protein|nr:ECF transporter S component [Clostridiaceae bacterium]
MSKNNRKFILTGLMTAFVFVLTYIFHIPVPYTSGYIHLGDSMIYISVMVLGPFFGALASGVGSMLADLFAGYAQFALPTLIIKSLMALIMGLLVSGKTRKATIVSVITSLSIWTTFCAGSIFYLKSQIASIGKENLVNSLSGADADLETINRTARIIENFPVYLTVGIVILVIVLSTMAYFFSRRDTNNLTSIKTIMGMSSAGMCMVMGYFVVESFMYSPVAALMSIPMNMIQFFAGITAASLFIPALRKAKL